MKSKMIIKRNGDKTKFDKNKIYEAIMKSMKYGSGIIDEKIANKITNEIDKIVEKSESDTTIFQIETYVYLKLIEYGHELTAKAYEGYRSIQSFKREINTTDDSILSLIELNNEEVMRENSNKDAIMASTQRDLIAGEVSKDITRRKKLPTRIVQAHDEGILHFHDMDYFMQNMFNCFSGDTKFISEKGTISFKDAGENTKLLVPTHTGEWKNAIVKKYGKQKLFKYTFKRQNGQLKSFNVTENHRWILQDGNVTTNLKIGDKLIETPIIENFVFDNCSIDEKKAWCLGFVIGDGNDYNQSETNYGCSLRLCKDKEKYANNFKQCGYSVNKYKSFNNDYGVCIPKMRKQEFLNKKMYNNMTLNEKIALINGLYAADGEKRKGEHPTAIFTSDKRILEMIYDLSEIAGYYLNKYTHVTNPTNFAPNGRDSHHIRFNRKQYRVKWQLISKEFVKEDDTWCLEVEDNKSFILSGGIVTGNCCLINIKDMLDNGTVINKRMIESPKSFQVACTVMTQIIAQVASSQYGGQSVDIRHLGKYLRKSKEKYISMFKDIIKDKDELNKIVDISLKKELTSGVQTIQYQINTLMTTNGQSPFVTLFLNIDDQDEYVEEVAMIVEEIIKQRIQGIKNEVGIYTTPTFPKLVYVLHEYNCLEGGKYDYITELAVKCSSKRLYPDYISAKEMKKIYEGNVFSPMGQQIVA